MKNHLLWAIETLKKQGYDLNADPALVQQAPWSEVTRFSTPHENFYLKKTPSALLLEIEVIQTLKKDFHISVPTIIANNPEEHCFLMNDAGIPLRAFFKEGLNADIFTKTLENYANFQSISANNLPRFFDIGVPDWRLAKLPFLYQELVNQETVLQQFGLTNEEINQCQDLSEHFQNICEKLGAYNIPNTFGHCDFHDNNVLIHPETHQTTMIDLGEVVVTHPFFSLLNMLNHVKESCNLTLQQVDELQQQALKPWLKLESLSNMQTMMTLIQQCWLIHAILGIYRLMLCVDPIEFSNIACKNHFATKLRTWINLSR